MHTHLTSEHVIILGDCSVFDMLLRDGGDSQSGAKENGQKESIRKHIDK